MDYPYSSIWVNGRAVMLGHILERTEPGRDDFERSTFSFVRDWFSRKDVFEIQTSGSTGVPKKIIITRDQMVASARLTAQALDLKQGYRALLCLDTRYIAGQMMLVRSFTTGMEITAVTPAANPFKDIPVGEHFDFAALVPLQIHEIVRSGKADHLNSIGTLIIGGGVIDGETHQLLQRFECRCYATYGMTETISHVALQRLNGTNRTDEFQTLPGISMQLDNRGCLVLDVPHLPERVVTNDLADITSSNTFKWIGRWDNIINTGGIKVIPEKIEEVVKDIVLQLNITEQFFITGVPDVKLGNKVVLVLECNAIADEVRNLLDAALKKSLSKHEVPKAILTVTPFIWTATGKINRAGTQKKLHNW